MNKNYLQDLFVDEAKAALEWHSRFGGGVTVEIRDNILYVCREVST